MLAKTAAGTASERKIGDATKLPANRDLANRKHHHHFAAQCCFFSNCGVGTPSVNYNNKVNTSMVQMDVQATEAMAKLMVLVTHA